MTHVSVPDIEQSIVRCRLILSAVALVALFVDPMQTGTGWVIGPFALGLSTLSVMGAHLAYSLGASYALTHQSLSRARLAALTTWADVFFGAAILFCTEGATSPFYAFFIFAVVAVGFRAGFRRTMLVTGVSLGLYLSLITVSGPGGTNFYIMRSVYLAIIGYLVGYLGQQRLNLETKLREAGAVSERMRIACDIHDGCVQALAGINLGLTSARELLRRGRSAAALAELGHLQASVNQEYDGLRVYMRSLAGFEGAPVPQEPSADTRFSVDIRFTGSGALVDQVLQILREGAMNVRRHAGAGTAALRVHTDGSAVRITIDDDGVGFRADGERPWSITSRVRELGGLIQVERQPGSGAHLAIALPRS